jgi:hypothetical protein
MSSDLPAQARVRHRGTRAWSRLVAAILRSPLHRLLDRRLIVLSYTGPRSGRRISLPVAYARDFDDLVVFVARHDDKRWWRSFRDGWPVTVRLQGRELAGRGRIVTADRRTRDVYEHRYPRAASRVASEHVPLFVRLEDLRPAGREVGPGAPA